MSAENERFFVKLEALGAEQVRANLASNVYLGPERSLAAAWLERRSEASSAAQLALARLASTEAQAANRIATVALAMAAISIALAVIGLFR